VTAHTSLCYYSHWCCFVHTYTLCCYVSASRITNVKKTNVPWYTTNYMLR